MKLLVLLLYFLEAAIAQEGPTVDLPQGTIQGYLWPTRTGRLYRTFARIPYAKPPVGPLRFQAPEPAEGWQGVRLAKDSGPPCPQMNIYMGGKPEGEEDCLYLTVYAPGETKDNYPVAVHFHGGGWIMGEGPRAKTPEFLMEEDIIIVDVNYRIGAFGFLSFEDDVAPGNMGLKDQAMALRWVRDSIAAFGGDPARVTLMGECAGADAVYLHMVSPMSAGLFSRGIAESGSGFTAQAVSAPGTARDTAWMVSRLFGCAGETAQVLDCLRTKPADGFVEVLKGLLKWQIDPVLTFGPVIERNAAEPFLPESVPSWKPPTVPLLTGITSAEGLLRTIFFTKNFDLSTLEADFDDRMEMTLLLDQTCEKPKEVLKKIRSYYFGDGSISPKENFKNLTDMIGDCWFAFGVLEGARLHSGPVYMYYFDYVGDRTISQFFGNASYAPGAFHTDEALYLWQVNGLPPWKGPDLKMSQDLVKVWTNFIKNGDPMHPDVIKFKWLPYMPGENYVEITKNGFQLKSGLISERYNFWKSLNFRDRLS